MRGSPPVQLALLLAVFIALAVPLLQLTTAHPAVKPDQQPAVNSPQKTLPSFIRVRTAHAPSALSLKFGGKELLEKTGIESALQEVKADLVIPREGIEFQIAATWPTGTRDTAVTVEVEPDSLHAQSITRWSTDNALNDTLVFQWKP